MGMSDVSSKNQEHIANRNLIFFCVMFSRASVTKLSCRIICTVQDFSRNRYYVFIVNRKQENKFDHAFRIANLRQREIIKKYLNEEINK